ncbi:MAG: hypothetical protein F6K09_39365 [Merismopedia sp. SIO2A8]|nr:hypothetical protein [Merismopedia sp. SIO2A8]
MTETIVPSDISDTTIIRLAVGHFSLGFIPEWNEFSLATRRWCGAIISKANEGMVMTPPFSPDFHLNVQQVDTVCLFELAWGQGQRLDARIPYPPVLEQRYQEWRQLYLTFYSQLSATDNGIG